MTRRVMKATFASLAAVLLMTACASPKREECRALNTVINAGADRIDKAQTSLVDPHGLEALADALEKSATEAEALKLTQADLQKHAKDYASLVRDVAKTARAIDAAGKSGDREKAQAANAEMEKLVGAEPKLIGEVNKACTAD